MNETSFPGTMLRERREALGHSIDEVQQHIHVPVKCIQGFESASFERMPGRAYAVGFLRSYCRFLDIDPEPFVDQYLVCTQPPQASRTFNLVMRANEPQSIERATPRWVNELITWGGICVVLALGWITYTTLVQPVAESYRSRVEAGGVEIEPPVHFFEEF